MTTEERAILLGRMAAMCLQLCEPSLSADRRMELEVALARAIGAMVDVPAREAQEKASAEAKRAADVKHRARIIHEVAKAIADVSEAGSPLDVAEAIAGGKIPHVKVEF